MGNMSLNKYFKEKYHKLEPSEFSHIKNISCLQEIYRKQVSCFHHLNLNKYMLGWFEMYTHKNECPKIY